MRSSYFRSGIYIFDTSKKVYLYWEDPQEPFKILQNLGHAVSFKLPQNRSFP